MITTQALIDKFKQALSEKWGYIWGTAGEQWTAGKQKELEKTMDADRAQGRQYESKWIGHRVGDCSGLFSWAFRELRVLVESRINFRQANYPAVAVHLAGSSARSQLH